MLTGILLKVLVLGTRLAALAVWCPSLDCSCLSPGPFMLVRTVVDPVYIYSQPIDKAETVQSLENPLCACEA